MQADRDNAFERKNRSRADLIQQLLIQNRVEGTTMGHDCLVQSISDSIDAAMRGESRSAYIQRAISDFLDTPMHVLFSDCSPYETPRPLLKPMPIVPAPGIEVAGAEAKLISLWRQMAFEEQQEAMRTMQELNLRSRANSGGDRSNG